MSSSEDAQPWRCGKVLVPTKVLMPSSHQAKLECCSVNPDPKGGTQLLLLQRAVKSTQRKVMAEQPAKGRGCRAQKGLLTSPADCVCTRLSPSAHCARSCDAQLNQRTPFQKELSPLKEDNDRDHCQPSSRLQLLKTCQCLSGEMQGPSRHMLNSARSTRAQPLTITLDLKYKPLLTALALHHD